MDRPSKPVNHDDTSVSPSADINENDLDCVVIPEISPRKSKLYTDDNSREVGDNVSELSSEEMVPTGSNYSGPSKKKNKGKEKATVSAAVSHSQLRRQPPDPFRNCELETASGTKNAFDIMRPQKQNMQELLIIMMHQMYSLDQVMPPQKRRLVDPQFAALLGSCLKKFILIIFDLMCVILKW
ncbi:hypothetical protein C2G38_2326406 [Gigaspora rosea]|uniref:Uncharacterized protein n=1 Tax=Gigaspora rosea TaxID=44941 RepID=A0A397UV23_9GLOM|nr:hypothetical protein C2G38_2326406 [Gigaspora rosea]